MPANETPMFEVIWEGDVCVAADPDEIECDNPFDWTPIAHTEIDAPDEDPS